VKIDVRYFASVREALGVGERVEAAEGSDVAALRDALVARGGLHADALGRGRVLRAARNRTMCDEATPLREGDEIGFFPPVTGG